MHWGNEYEREPDETQRSMARFLMKEGVDAIIGSHPHVIQPVEILYNGNDSSDFEPGCLFPWEFYLQSAGKIQEWWDYDSA